MRDVVTDWHRNADGEAFRLRGWPSARPTTRAVFVHHGLGEHSGRYETFAREFGELPIHLWGFDCRGHGESAGKRGHAEGLGGLADELAAMLPVLFERSGAETAVLYGHSMGSAVVATYLENHGPHPALSGVWLSSVPTRVTMTPEIRVKALAARVLDKLVPRLTLASGLRPADISSVAEEVKRYVDDPLVHDRISARLGWSMLRDAPALVPDAGRITLPILMWHGADDAIVDRRGSEDLFARLGSEDRTIEIFDEAFHEVHHERPETVQRLFALLRGWLEQRDLVG